MAGMANDEECVATCKNGYEVDHTGARHVGAYSTGQTTAFMSVWENKSVGCPRYKPEFPDDPEPMPHEILYYTKNWGFH